MNLSSSVRHHLERQGRRIHCRISLSANRFDLGKAPSLNQFGGWYLAIWGWIYNCFVLQMCAGHVNLSFLCMWPYQTKNIRRLLRSQSWKKSLLKVMCLVYLLPISYRAWCKDLQFSRIKRRKQKFLTILAPRSAEKRASGHFSWIGWRLRCSWWVMCAIPFHWCSFLYPVCRCATLKISSLNMHLNLDD